MAKCIRDAVASAASDGALPVAAGVHLDELLTAGVQPHWVVDRTRATYESAPLPHPRADGNQGPDVAKFLRSASHLIEVLSLFGLRDLGDGGWVVPSVLGEFARSVLQVSRSWWTSHPF